MKSLLLVVCTFACAYAVTDPLSAVLRSSSNVEPDGNYQWSFETENGISSAAEGRLKTVGKDEVALEVTGYDKYVGPDGQNYEVKYVANEFGYQPEAAHLPTPPAPQEIPEYIVRAINYIAAHPPKSEREQRAG